MAEFVKCANVNEIEEGTPKKVMVGTKTIALFNVEGKYYALANSCVHKGGPLGEGFMDGKIVTCPWHAWKFDVTTGISPVNPNAQILCFNVKVEGEDLLIEI